ncbi:hypothetical protein VNI00_013016 [Paramarasmius palmivorus]|uniref:Uncharacterized protein n=1 Tax=Paramarasmius palmivorus TaxID=297713 RepID=A0AAW0BZJ7_9AGAR
MWNNRPPSFLSPKLSEEQDLRDEKEVARLLWPRAEDIWHDIWKEVVEGKLDEPVSPTSGVKDLGVRYRTEGYSTSNGSSVLTGSKNSAAAETPRTKNSGYYTRVPIFVPPFELPTTDQDDGDVRELDDHERGLLTIAAYGSLCAETNRKFTRWQYELVED